MPNIPDQRQELIRVPTGLQIITVTTQPGVKTVFLWIAGSSHHTQGTAAPGTFR